MRTTLTGTEEIAIETHGTIAEDVARALLGPGLQPFAQGNRVELGLLLASVREMKPVESILPDGLGLSIPGVDYREMIVRVGALFEGAPAWFLVACAIDATLVRIASRFMVRYPMREATIALTHDAFRAASSVTIEDASLTIEALAMSERPEAIPPRRALVRDAGAVYEVPWEERGAPTRATAKINVKGPLVEALTGAPVLWSGDATIHLQRTRRIGHATAVPGASLTR